jgi:hypothetical protein
MIVIASHHERSMTAVDPGSSGAGGRSRVAVGVIVVACLGERSGRQATHDPDDWGAARSRGAVRGEQVSEAPCARSSPDRTQGP